MEHKRFAVAIHYRNVAAEHVAEVVAAAHRRRTAAWAASDQRPQGRRAAARRRLGQGRRAALDQRSDRPTGPAVPIYIGDDLTDEDAFDAIRFTGMGIVVRHDEDGERPTAAQFTLQGPREVPSSSAAEGMAGSEKQASDGTWAFTFEGYDPHNEKLREALCTVGNGYFATRGAAPESKAGQVHYPGTYAAGVYNRLR